MVRRAPSKNAGQLERRPARRCVVFYQCEGHLQLGAVDEEVLVGPVDPAAVERSWCLVDEV